MSDVIAEAITKLNEKLSGADLGGTVKFAIEDEGSIIVDGDGARAGDEDADVTLSANAETFEAMLNGEENPTAAFMSGKLTIDGDMGMAMKLAGMF